MSWELFKVILILRKKPKQFENSQILRWHVNQSYEFILEQCVANYDGDNTIAK